MNNQRTVSKQSPLAIHLQSLTHYSTGTTDYTTNVRELIEVTSLDTNQLVRLQVQVFEMSCRDNTCPQKVVIFKFEGHASVTQMDAQSTLSLH